MLEKKINLPDSYVFINGKMILSKDAKLSIWDRGLIYGDGFFTTMRAEKGRIFFLKEHIRRLKDSCELFGIKFPDFLSQEAIYHEILNLNDLNEACAMIKVLITRGVVEGLGLPYSENPTHIIITKPYQPPYGQYQSGWHLITFYIPRSCRLSAHKSLNYLFNMWAKEYALSQGADEAILVGCDGHVKETSVGTILFQKNGIWFTPEGEDILPSITLKMLSRVWNTRGITIKRKITYLEDLLDADQVWVLNSLMGIMPVSRINDHLLRSDQSREFAGKCRDWLWNYALSESF